MASSWHNQTKENVLHELHATDAGLSSQEALARLETYGPNELPKAPKASALKRFLLQFHNILIYVLIGAAVVTACLEHWADTVVILAVVVINAIIGYIQEGKAEKAMDSLREMLAPHASVLHDSERISVAGSSLVPGDIVLLEAGDKVPADLRLISAHGLSIQEAILTGESVPVEKHLDPVAVEAPLGDRSCLAFSGTLVASGQGKGVVVSTGSHTEIGRISGLLSDVQVLTTPLVEQMSVFAKWLTILILLVAAVLLAYGHFVGGHDFFELFMAIVGLSVAAIPEGLPAILTITLAIGVQAMAKRNAIVRRLPAIETIGSVSVICTDKTGTLTRNEMSVASVLTPAHLFTVEGHGYAPEGALYLDGVKIDAHEDASLNELSLAATLCNDAFLRQHDGAWVVEGDPMEGALLAFSGKVIPDTRLIRSTWTRADAIPFDSKHRFMATLNVHSDGHGLVFVKGAPEKILELCQHQRAPAGSNEPLQAAYWNDKTEALAAQGQRVLAFAMRTANPEHSGVGIHDLEGSLTLIGMVGMIDPPRAEAITAVQECHEAGIRVKMITGDHAKTAAAIGKKIGLMNPETVLTGADLDKMSDAILKEEVMECDIFARTSPEHKLRLVMALQSHGMTVAMTGDGVNDAPALKRADAGIAMGKKGSEAAKEASEVVLADDNFASIVAAVREGRTVYDNIKKVISWTLPTNAGEAMTIIMALLLGLALPITPIQILWVNLITAVALGIPLAFEPTEENAMRRPPRGRNESLIDAGLTWHIILVSILFLGGVFGIFNYAMERGYSIEMARTMAMNTLVVMEIFHLLFIRNIYNMTLTLKNMRGTKILWGAILVIVIAQGVVTYLPFMQSVFATESIGLLDGVLILAVGVILFGIVESEKQLRLRFKKLQGGQA